MGEVVQLYNKENSPSWAECPECGSAKWFIMMDEEGEYASDLDFLLGMCSLVCAECKAEFDFVYGEIIIAEKEK